MRTPRFSQIALVCSQTSHVDLSGAPDSMIIVVLVEDIVERVPSNAVTKFNSSIPCRLSGADVGILNTSELLGMTGT